MLDFATLFLHLIVKKISQHSIFQRGFLTLPDNLTTERPLDLEHPLSLFRIIIFFK